MPSCHSTHHQLSGCLFDLLDLDLAQPSYLEHVSSGCAQDGLLYVALVLLLMEELLGALSTQRLNWTLVSPYWNRTDACGTQLLDVRRVHSLRLELVCGEDLRVFFSGHCSRFQILVWYVLEGRTDRKGKRGFLYEGRQHQ